MKKSLTLFDKATEIIRRLQKAEWGNPDERGMAKAEIDVHDLAANHDEARCLGGIVRCILSNRCANQYIAEAMPPLAPEDFNGFLEASINQQEKEAFCKDNSLNMPFTPLRKPTESFTPTNMRQAIELARWKEGQHWLKQEGDEGFTYAMTSSHGGFDKSIFYNEAYVQYANAMLEEARAGALGRPVQIWGNRRGTLWVPQEDVNDVLVDFIGLDPKQLGIEGQRVEMRIT